MLDRVLRSLGSTALSIALLIVGAVLMLIGSIYAGSSKSLIGGLNEERLQDWLLVNLAPSFTQLWWMIPLITVLLLLGINGAACAMLRLCGLLATRRGVPPRAFFTALCPSLVHVGFLVVMLGHAVTFTMGVWRRVDIDASGLIDKAPLARPLILENIDHEMVSEDSAVVRQASRTEVTLRDHAGGRHVVRYMEPVSIDGYDILLDEKRLKNKPGMLQLFFVHDPGIVLIVPAFLLILSLMTWYFIELGLAARRRTRR